MSIYEYFLDNVIDLDSNKNYRFILTDNDGYYVGRNEGLTGTGTGYSVNQTWGSSGNDFDLVLEWAGLSVEIVSERDTTVKVGTIACYVEYGGEVWRFLGYANFSAGARNLSPDEAIEFSDITINLQQSFDPPENLYKAVSGTITYVDGLANNANPTVELRDLNDNTVIDVHGNECKETEFVEMSSGSTGWSYGPFEVDESLTSAYLYHTMEMTTADDGDCYENPYSGSVFDVDSGDNSESITFNSDPSYCEE